MRGIKECINWLIDNPMRELECNNGGYWNIRYNKVEGVFQCFDTDCEEWIEGPGLESFNNCEWQPVQKKYTFTEAFTMMESGKPMQCLSSKVIYSVKCH